MTWAIADSPNVRVQARIDVADGQVRTSSLWNTFFEDPRGWASFIDIARATDDAGAALSIRRGPTNDWQIGDGYTGTAILHYTVDFSFATERWPVGNEQVALFVDGGLYTTGLPLFVFGVEPEISDIRIEVPDGWRISTSWQAIEDNYFRATGVDRLTRNTIAVGDFHHEVFAAGPFELRLALLGEIAQSGTLVRETFIKVFDFYRELYKPTDSAVFMIAMIPGPNDGEAYMDSFAAAAPDPPGVEDRIVWANLLAHEFGHYWNGKRIGTTREHYAERQWFSEGGTEYLAMLALKEAGLVDDTMYRQILSRYLSMHLLFAQNPNFENVTLRQAGSSKWRNRPGVYDSGFAAAYCLDGLIRENTDQSRTFADVLIALDEKFGRTKTPYVFDDLVAVSSEVAGADLSGFFTTHISGKAALPVTECAARMEHTAVIDGYHAYIL
ncbi:MAG: hypothetical protein OEM63_01390 [Gammaproteobacteria bacterium]|nr:hypothetical protein [Gammaproteobacteria bacterium]